MKKILCLALALIMIMMVAVACKKDKTGAGESSSTNDTGTPDFNGSTLSSDTKNPDESNVPAVDENDRLLEECNETVYVINSDLRLRSAMNFDDDSNIKTTVPVGTKLQRIAKGVIGDEQWSKVVYDNKEYYTSSKYLSTEKDGAADTSIETTPETDPEVTLTFEDRDETVYVNPGDNAEAAYIRSTPDKSGTENVVGTAVKGTELKRTGIMFENPDDPEKLGWSRVEYNGKVCYIRNSQLTTEKPAA